VLAKERINLWCAMTSLAGRDLPQSDHAEAVVALASKAYGFGSELALEVDDCGNWTVEIFCHEESENNVKMTVSRNGHISVIRTKRNNDVLDRRQISF